MLVSICVVVVVVVMVRPRPGKVAQQSASAASPHLAWRPVAHLGGRVPLMARPVGGLPLKLLGQPQSSQAVYSIVPPLFVFVAQHHKTLSQSVALLGVFFCS